MEDKLYIILEKVIDKNDKSGISDYVTQFHFGTREDVKKFNQMIKSSLSLEESDNIPERFTIEISSAEYSVKMRLPKLGEKQVIKVEQFQGFENPGAVKFVEIDNQTILEKFIQLIDKAKSEEIYPQEEQKEVSKKHPHLLEGGVNPPNTSAE
ncbi:hypothetical protein [Lagierella sp.]|uniref:hypothetical protein n=1 Tax=Lagierella sp. TaxID=2849657 RepID=UPI0026038B0A|nr:hypothetical protein [Lagierella sp.]